MAKARNTKKKSRAKKGRARRSSAKRGHARKSSAKRGHARKATRKNPRRRTHHRRARTRKNPRRRAHRTPRHGMADAIFGRMNPRGAKKGSAKKSGKKGGAKRGASKRGKSASLTARVGRLEKTVGVLKTEVSSVGRVLHRLAPAGLPWHKGHRHHAITGGKAGEHRLESAPIRAHLGLPIHIGGRPLMPQIEPGGPYISRTPKASRSNPHRKHRRRRARRNKGY